MNPIEWAKAAGRARAQATAFYVDARMSLRRARSEPDLREGHLRSARLYRMMGRDSIKQSKLYSDQADKQFAWAVKRAVREATRFKAAS